MQLQVHFVSATASHTYHVPRRARPSVSLSTLKSHEALKMQTSWMNDGHQQSTKYINTKWLQFVFI